MAKIINLTEDEMSEFFDNMIDLIDRTSRHPRERRTTIYGIPRGGIPVAYRIAATLGLTVVDQPGHADIIVDDIVSSGKTRTETMKKAPTSAEFYSLLTTEGKEDPPWYVFPWEASMEASAEDIPLRLIEFVGENVNRDGLKATPGRFLKAWKFFTQGYDQDPAAILSTSFVNDESYDEMVVLRDIEFYSTCEHHLVPFFGKIHIAYIPEDKVVGISKLARLTEWFSRRLQVQERLTEQIANAMMEHLKPLGVAVLVEAQHLCMVSRGVQKQNSVMVTSSLKGVLEKQEARMEFLLLKR
jgi:GTP cyclohydrolase I